MSEYIEPFQLYYSEIFPNGIYAHYENDGAEIPVPDTMNPVRTTPILTNILSHELFYCKRLNIDSEKQKEVLVSEILNPSAVTASWPVDLVRIDLDSNKGVDTLNPSALRHLYCDEHHNVNEVHFNHVLLFPYEKSSTAERGGYAYYVPLDKWLKSLPFEQRNYKNEKIRKVCFNICKRLMRLNQEGYLYFDFSLSRFMVDSKLDVTIEYTNLLMNKNLHYAAAKGLTAKYGFIPLDFIEPYMFFLFNKDSNEAADSRNTTQSTGFCAETQNYSLAAMIFYLMFGRKPYEGHRLMQYQDDEADLVRHYAFLRNYYLKEENIDFIFDDSYDNSNLLIDDYTDIYSEDIKLWRECPSEIRNMFVSALERQHALRNPCGGAPRPKSWVEVFQHLSWGV